MTAQGASRVFVKGVPPKCSENDFKQHFSKVGVVTDVKLFPTRKFGYVGYKTPEEAQKAVKYFNRTFIGMAKLSVGIAEPYKFGAPAETVVEPASGVNSEEVSKKRKRDEGQPDPKLKEFLETMGTKKTKTWANEDVLLESQSINQMPVADLSEDEYQDLSKEEIKENAKSSKGKSVDRPAPAPEILPEPEPEPEPEPLQLSSEDLTGLSDAEWMRRRTNRVLELDSSIPDRAPAITPLVVSSKIVPQPISSPIELEKRPAQRPVDTATPDLQPPIAEIERTRRLFIRNLPYTATEDDLHAYFSEFGSVEEVRTTYMFLSMMKPDRDI
jgi:multiple RNA-binding domain-containing protein 1